MFFLTFIFFLKKKQGLKIFLIRVSFLILTNLFLQFKIINEFI
jgi:hypothetical protein